jgi:hypothetical protein
MLLEQFGKGEGRIMSSHPACCANEVAVVIIVSERSGLQCPFSKAFFKCPPSHGEQRITYPGISGICGIGHLPAQS